MLRSLLLLPFLLGLGIPAVLAGIADSALPVLDPSAKTLLLLSVPGVRNDDPIRTVFTCTSTSTAPMKVAVEIFDSQGTVANDAAATAWSLNPGATAVFVTGSVNLVGYNVLFAAIPAIDNLSARILATSKSLICTAYFTDGSTWPPPFASYLPMIAKTKQKATN
jgi:hypothetical protein